MLPAAQHAYRLSSAYNSQAWTLGARLHEVGDNFNPEVGFLSRARLPEGRRERVLPLPARRTSVRSTSCGRTCSMRSFWNFDGFHETFYMHMDQHWEMKSGHEFHTGMNSRGRGS